MLTMYIVGYVRLRPALHNPPPNPSPPLRPPPLRPPRRLRPPNRTKITHHPLHHFRLRNSNIRLSLPLPILHLPPQTPPRRQRPQRPRLLRRPLLSGDDVRELCREEGLETAFGRVCGAV